MGSFPGSIVYLNYGDEKVAQSTLIGGNALGTAMELPDGRKFRHMRAGSVTALQAGVITSTSAETAGHGNVSGSGLLTSATTTENLSTHTAVYLVSKSAAVTLDQYAGGLLTILGPASSTAYIGRVHRIKENASAAVSSRFKITLEPYDGLKTALSAGLTLCSLRKSPYQEQVVFNAGTVIAPPAGATPTAVSVSFYYWGQTRGPIALQQSATVVTVGQAIHASSAAAGSVTTVAADSTKTEREVAFRVGYALGAAAASEAVLTYLTLE